MPLDDAKAPGGALPGIPEAARRGDLLRKASVTVGCVSLFLVFSVLAVFADQSTRQRR